MHFKTNAATTKNCKTISLDFTGVKAISMANAAGLWALNLEAIDTKCRQLVRFTLETFTLTSLREFCLRDCCPGHRC